MAKTESIKVFVATKETQGKGRSKDFCFVPEGELVRPTSTRAMAGFECQTCTTTIKVIEVKMTAVEYYHKYEACMKKVCGGLGMPTQKELIKDVKQLLQLANGFKVGTILGLTSRGMIIRREP